LIRVFARELSTPTGRVALLTACAEMLNHLDDKPECGRWRNSINDIARNAIASESFWQRRRRLRAQKAKAYRLGKTAPAV
jgi:hypothetical protein